jgi:hypothetical protein
VAETTHRPRTLALVEDVEWLVEMGSSWDEICRRFNRRPESLERVLERLGRRDLYTKARSRDRDQPAI